MNIDLNALVDPTRDIGVPGGAELLDFSEAVIGSDREALDQARLAVEKAIGPQAVPAASAIAANFSKNDRIANGCGIPMDPTILKATADIRAQLRLDEYRSAINTFRHFPEARTSGSCTVNKGAP